MNPQADPLAQLRDIHLPDAVSAWPPGPGWWFLGITLLIVLCALVWWLIRRYRGNAHRRQAGREIDAALEQWQSDEDDGAFALVASDVLKRVALQHYPRTDVASLSGHKWCEFLDQHWRKTPTPAFSDTNFAELAYSENISGSDIQAIYRLSRSWLQQQRGRS